MLLTGFECWLKRLSYAAAIAGGLCMLAVMAIICANIAMRAIGPGLHGAVEISGYLCALAVGLCLPAAQLNGSHIELGVLSSSFSERALLAQKSIVSLLSIIILLVVFKELLSLAGYTSISGELIEGFPFSFMFMVLGMALGVLLHGLVFICCMLRALLARQGEGQ